MSEKHLLEDLLKQIEEMRSYKLFNKKMSIRDFSKLGDWKRVRIAARKYLDCRDFEVDQYATHAGLCSIYLMEQYENLRDLSFFYLFGRKYTPMDYRVSCVCRDEFPSHVKEKLREYYHESQNYRALSSILRQIPRKR